MTQPKIGQKFRIKSLPGRVFKSVKDDNDFDNTCMLCAFTIGENTNYICQKLICGNPYRHYIEVPNAKTEK